MALFQKLNNLYSVYSTLIKMALTLYLITQQNKHSLHQHNIKELIDDYHSHI